MASQLTAEVAQIMANLSGTSSQLNLLDGSQALRVELSGMMLVEQVNAQHLHGLIPLEDWFFELAAAQRSQIIDHYDSLIKEYGLRLVWYARGHTYGYRFDTL